MAIEGKPLRPGFGGELDQLRIQVELMGVRVDQNLDRLLYILDTGDEAVVATTYANDDDIDAMSVSLTERCYDLLRREAPVASDFRFLVSALRVVSELERVGDLALRVIKLAPKLPILKQHPAIFDTLSSMARSAIDRYREAMMAWATMNTEMARDLVAGSGALDLYYERLMDELARVGGTDAVQIALTSFTVDRSLERISDHATIIGARLLYLLTGDPDHLVREVR